MFISTFKLGNSKRVECVSRTRWCFVRMTGDMMVRLNETSSYEICEMHLYSCSLINGDDIFSVVSCGEVFGVHFHPRRTRVEVRNVFRRRRNLRGK